MRQGGLAARVGLLLALWPAACAVRAWVLTVTPGPRAIYLQVGAGTNKANNATVNQVTLALPAAQLGSGTPQAMTSNSTVSASVNDGFAICNPPQQVYIAAWFRRPGGASGGPAVLQVTTPPSLLSGGDSIAFTSISWTSTANGNPAADIPAGTFSGGTQTLRNIAANTWVENCLSFIYANATVPPAGTYTGRATYTLSAP